ncbi:EAL and HDOD domain-containing protein [Noviherbaspirillum galbum]|uniref:EAL domain-containing protein n=1 Tax=Noviherbaspirillum galbum TaxID=2709383 RepID=A0A6B3SGU9_9BURK|nr:EAL domain-containing protein [Noviherbaspirillum galbum]NEX59860.1 EAL domain-containing protein [Noviherbaspirillum galbum]
MKQSAARIPDALHVVSQEREQFFLARQPIVDRGRELVAFELLFRRAEAGPADVTDDIMATASVISHASELGLVNVIGGKLGFINVDASALMSDFIRVLPPSKFVLEILETVDVTDAIVERVRHLIEAGYTFALDDVVAESEPVRRLLPLADIIKCDVCAVSSQELDRLSRRFMAAGKSLLAEKVETPEKFEQCLALGFDFFQGNFLARPVVMTGTKVAPSAATVLQLMTQILSHADADTLAQVIERDPALRESLLDLARRAEPAGAAQVRSIGEALRLMGRRRLHRWLQIMLYAQTGQPGRAASPLVAKAAARGRLMELLAARLHPGDRAAGDTAFTAGALSLMHILFDMPVQRILPRLPANQALRDALTARQGEFGTMLRLVESLDESGNDGVDGGGNDNGKASGNDGGHGGNRHHCDRLQALLDSLGLASEDLYALQVQAYEWSDRIAHG